MTEEPKTEREARIAGKIVHINVDEISGHLDEMVRHSVEDTLNTNNPLERVTLPKSAGARESWGRSPTETAR